MPLRYSMIRQILGGLRQVAPGAPCGLNLLDPSRHVFTTWCLPHAAATATGTDSPSTLVSNVLGACNQDQPQPRTEAFRQAMHSVTAQIAERTATLLPPDSQLRAQNLLQYLLQEDAAPALLPEDSGNLCQTAVELLACLPMPPFALISGAMYARYLGVTLDSVPEFPEEIGPGRCVSLQGAPLGHFDYRAAHYQNFPFRSSGQGTLYYVLYVIGALGGNTDWKGEIYHVAPLFVGGDFRGMLFSHLPEPAQSPEGTGQPNRTIAEDLAAVARQAETWLLQLDQLELSSYPLSEQIDRDQLPERFIEAVTTTRNVHYAVIMDRDRHIHGVWSRPGGQGGLASEVPLRKQEPTPAFAQVFLTEPQGQAEQELMGETGVERLITDLGEVLKATVVEEYQQRHLPLRAGLAFNLFTESAFLFFSTPSQIGEQERQKLQWEWAISAYGVRELVLNRIRPVRYDPAITDSLHGATQFKVLIVGSPSAVWTDKFRKRLTVFTGGSIDFNVTVVEQLPQDYADHDLLVGYHLPPDEFDHKIAHGSVPCAVRIGHLTSSNMSLFPVQVADRDEWKLLECVLSRVIQARAEKARQLRAEPVLCVAMATDEDIFDEVVARFKDGRTLDITVAQRDPVKGHQLLVIGKTGAGKVTGVARQFYKGVEPNERTNAAIDFLLAAIKAPSTMLSTVASDFVGSRRRTGDVKDPNKPPPWAQHFTELVDGFGLSGGLLVHEGHRGQPSFPCYGSGASGWKKWKATGKVYTLSRSEGGTLALTEATE